MRLVTLDFETHYAQGYSLTNMTPLGYVMDERFQTIGCSIKVDHHPTDVFFGESAVRKALSSIDHIIKDALLIGHNMLGFDSYVLAYRYNVRPKMWGCTMAMARPIHAKTCGLGLAKLVAHYAPQLKAMGIASVKDNAVLVQTRGKRLEDFTPTELEAMRTYNRNDTDQCYGLFQLMRKHYTPAELWQIDAITRMRTEPGFELDTPLLQTAASVERTRKHAALLDLARTLKLDNVAWGDDLAVAEQIRSELASASKFSALLESLGVEVPTKPSPTVEGKMVPALAKTDEAFIALQEHDNPTVAAAARARLDVKSTLLETRIQKFLTAGSLADGRLPIPLRYCGADTTGRDSGEEYNCMTAGHELLTPNGWVDIKDWTPDSPVMQWSITGELSWCFAPGKVQYEHDGPVVALNGPFARGVFTPDHRIPLFRGRQFSETTAARVAARSGLDGIPAAGRYEGPETGGPTCAQVRFLVALAADGCLAKAGQIRFGFRRQRKIDRIQGILRAVGLGGVVRTYDYRNKPGGHWVAVIPKSAVAPWMAKGFGPWIMSLSRAALDALVAELPHWDGMPHSKTGNTCFFTSNYEQACWVSTALHLSGKPARVGARSHGRFDVYARSTDRTSATGEIEHFTGTVYCPQVETGFVLVRYDGAIHVTGNCQNLPRVNPKSPKPSDALRQSLRAPNGKLVIVADQSGIELRVNHFLWKVPSSMALYQSDPQADLYRAFSANSVYNVPVDEVTKDQRHIGKLCLLEGTLVLTERGEVPIEQVTAGDRVWDGVEWSNTLGAIYKGEHDVIEHDGLTGTPDHEVWVEDGRKVRLGFASTQSLRLARSGEGGTPLGFSGAGSAPNHTCERAQVRRGSLHDVRYKEADELRQFAGREDAGLSTVQPEMRCPPVATSTHGSGAAALHEPERPGVFQIWSAGHQILLPERGEGRGMGGRESGPEKGHATGPGGQQRALRAGEPKVGHTQHECQQPIAVEGTPVSFVPAGIPGSQVCGQHPARHAEQRYDGGANNLPVEVAVTQAKRRVWDLLECGPRHRFTANGRLVSNCHLGLGFGSGHATFQRIAKVMGGIDIPLGGVDPATGEILNNPDGGQTCKDLVDTWRGAYNEIVQGWRSCGSAILHIDQNLEKEVDPWGLVHTCSEGFVLPSGRLIRYPDLREEQDGEWPDGRPRTSWFYAHGRHKARITGPKADENIVQALARDSIFDCAVEFFRLTGLRPALRVHDELVYVVDEAPARDLLDTLQGVLHTPPKWWPELVVWSEGDAAKNYGAAK